MTFSSSPKCRNPEDFFSKSLQEPITLQQRDLSALKGSHIKYSASQHLSNVLCDILCTDIGYQIMDIKYRISNTLPLNISATYFMILYLRFNISWLFASAETPLRFGRLFTGIHFSLNRYPSSNASWDIKCPQQSV